MISIFTYLRVDVIWLFLHSLHFARLFRSLSTRNGLGGGGLGLKLCIQEQAYPASLPISSIWTECINSYQFFALPMQRYLWMMLMEIS